MRALIDSLVNAFKAESKRKAAQKPLFGRVLGAQIIQSVPMRAERAEGAEGAARRKKSDYRVE